MSTRPTIKDPDIIRAAVKLILPDVLAWLPDDEDDPEGVERQLIKAVERYSDNNGYEIARRLDSDGWNPDAHLVEILEDFNTQAYRARRDAVAKWVTENSVRPEFKSGDRVTFSYRKPGEFEAHDVTGEIINVDERHAEYTVCVLELGHVRSGGGPRGIIKAFEDVRAAEQQPESEDSP